MGGLFRINYLEQDYLLIPEVGLIDCGGWMERLEH